MGITCSKSIPSSLSVITSIGMSDGSSPNSSSICVPLFGWLGWNAKFLLYYIHDSFFSERNIKYSEYSGIQVKHSDIDQKYGW